MISQEDLTLFSSTCPEDLDRAIRELARRVEALTMQHRPPASAVTNDAWPSPYHWPERNQG